MLKGSYGDRLLAEPTMHTQIYKNASVYNLCVYVRMYKKKYKKHKSSKMPKKPRFLLNNTHLLEAFKDLFKTTGG